jgi:hypothetical protein
MTPEFLTELRTFLKGYRASPTSEEHQLAADTVTNLIPALVDSITDAELEELYMLASDYIMTSIIHAPRQPEQETSASEAASASESIESN